MRKPTPLAPTRQRRPTMPAAVRWLAAAWAVASAMAIAAPASPTNPAAPRALVRTLALQAPPLPCPSSPSGAPVKPYANRDLSFFNFSRLDLSNADFSGANLKGTVFIGANLTGANFSGATIVETGGVATTDFSFATLDSACFIGTHFNAPTYFTYASLTCADFSQTMLANAIFGDQPLKYNAAASCRTAFRQTTMNCEFIDDWHAFDLAGVILSPCLTQLAGRNFAGTRMAGVDLTGAVLDGTQFIGADLQGAVLDGVSLQCLKAGNSPPRCADLSNASLQGATFIKANLSGASLYHAFLSDNANNSISRAASLRQAHLKNVNLAYAELSGVDFSLANFYGNTPTNPKRCATSLTNDAGFTNGCANAHQANMATTVFNNAYLYGVDFSGAAISGASFDQAVLSGANFMGATIDTFAPGPSRTKFTRAHLQGTNLDQAASLDADLTDAFVDFRRQGNLINILLDGANHNRFPCAGAAGCKPASGLPVCVWVPYAQTTVPAANTKTTCPDGKLAGSGCGAPDTDAGKARWQSSLAPGAPPDPGPPPGWYDNDSTYTPKTSDSAVVCRGLANNPRVINW